MAITLRYLGWSSFEITLEDGRRIVLDPMLAGSPDDGIAPSPVRAEELDPDLVLVTHAAGDHVGDAFPILARGKGTLLCDVATRFLAVNAGIPAGRILAMVPGVRFDLGGFFVKALPAHHLSFRPLGDNKFISAPPLSYLVTSLDGVRVFFGGDTSISLDHRLYGQLYKPDIAVLGVGGVNVAGQCLTELYPEEAALVAKWLGARVAIPVHYRFEEGKSFAKELRRQAPKAKAAIMQPGERLEFSAGRRPRRATAGGCV
jgi:L-ascorbate metabolism protein UlaG (beta-lactamase superfamily)